MNDIHGFLLHGPFTWHVLLPSCISGKCTELKISVGVYSVVLDIHFFLTTLSSRILHNIVNQLYFNEKRQNRRSRIPEDKNKKMALSSLSTRFSEIYIELAAQSCPTLCDPVDCSPPAPLSMGFSKQEYWSGLPFPPPGDPPNRTHVSYISCIGRQVLYH